MNMEIRISIGKLCQYIKTFLNLFLILYTFDFLIYGVEIRQD